MGIRGDSVLVSWRRFFWIAAEVVLTPRRSSYPGTLNVAELRPPLDLDLPFGVVARLVCPLPLHLPPYAQEY